jgi:hypothetical protein
MRTTSLITAFATFALVNGVHLTLGAELPINQRLQATFDRAKAQGLTKGMTAAQVESIIGKPDNADWNVGFQSGASTIRVWMCIEKDRAAFASWRDYLRDDRRYGLGYFLLLVNNQLESPVLSLTSKDAVVLHNLATNGQATSRDNKPLPQTPSKP